MDDDHEVICEPVPQRIVRILKTVKIHEFFLNFKTEKSRILELWPPPPALLVGDRRTNEQPEGHRRHVNPALCGGLNN